MICTGKKDLEELCQRVGWKLDVRTPSGGAAHAPIWHAEVSICGNLVASHEAAGKKAHVEAAACEVALGFVRREEVSAEGDRIAECVVAAWESRTMEGQRLKFAKGVLAGIVMEREGRLEVVALGCGTSHLPRSQLDNVRPADVLFDCHAEVLARRAFVRFLLSEMDLDSSTVVSRHSKGWVLQPGINFHLYVSSLPCGDASCCLGQGEARVHDELVVNAPGPGLYHWPQTARATHGKLRAKMSCGESLSVLGAASAADERLCKMSCSDKILRWNVLGLQGAILSTVLDPIYLASITVGDAAGYSHSHLSRAVCCRAAPVGERLRSLDLGPFKLNHPQLYRSQVAWSRAGHGEKRAASSYAGWWAGGGPPGGQAKVHVFAATCTPDTDAGALKNADPVSMLHHWGTFGHGMPDFKPLSRSGPDHAPIHAVHVSFPEAEALAGCTGVGDSVQQAKASAAQQLLDQLRQEATANRRQRIAQSSLHETFCRVTVERGGEMGLALGERERGGGRGGEEGEPRDRGRGVEQHLRQGFEGLKQGSVRYWQAKAAFMEHFVAQKQAWVPRIRLNLKEHLPLPDLSANVTDRPASAPPIPPTPS